VAASARLPLVIHILDEPGELREGYDGAVVGYRGPAVGVSHRCPVHLGGEGTEAVLVGLILGVDSHLQQRSAVERVIEDDHGGTLGGRSGVLDGFTAGVEQHGALVVGAGMSRLRISATSIYGSH